MNTRYRAVNPLLGIYFGIFTAAYISLFLMLLIGDYMGVLNSDFKFALTAAAFVLTIIIAFAAFTSIRDEFFVSGRRIPAGLNGLILFVISIGGAGLAGVTGVMFFAGVDGISLLLGFLGGLIFAGVLFAPFMRKSGAYTLSSYFQIRFQSRFIRSFSALFIGLILLLLALAELSLVKQVGALVFNLEGDLAVWLVVGGVITLVLPGGVRSMSWAQCGLAIIVILGLVLPLVIISLQYTNLPIGQLTYGSLIDDIGKFQNLQNNVSPTGQAGVASLINGAPQVLGFSFLDGDRPLSQVERLTVFIIVMCGLASLPTILMRAGTSANVFQVRKTFAWGTVLMLLLVTTIPAYTVFFRYLIYTPENEILTTALPYWINELSQFGLVSYGDANSDGVISIPELRFSRDAIFIGLPMIAELNLTLQSFCFAALLAATAAAFAASLVMLAKVVTNDLFARGTDIDPEVFRNWMLLSTRLAIIIIGVFVGWIATQYQFDSFRLLISAFVLSAAALFPVLLLSIWWRRMSLSGAVAGLMFGGGFALMAIIISDFGAGRGFFGFDLVLCGLIGLLIGLFMAVIVAISYGKPTPQIEERLRDIRTPGGEAVYDRLLRLAMPRRTTGDL